MATFGFQLEFLRDEWWVEGFYTVDSHPPSEWPHPIVTIIDNVGGPEILDVFARYRTVHVGGVAGGTDIDGLGVMIRLKEPCVSTNQPIAFDLYLDGSGWVVTRIVGIEGGISRKSGKYSNGPTQTVTYPQELRVLIVDDCMYAAASTAMLVEACGHRAIVAHDGETALSLAGKHRPDVAFLDVGISGMSAWELTRRLRLSPATATAFLVLVSGYGQERDKDAFQTAGCDLHLLKPVAKTLLKWMLMARQHLLTARERAKQSQL